MNTNPIDTLGAPAPVDTPTTLTEATPTMKPTLVAVHKVGPAPKEPGDRGNPWIHRWFFSDGGAKDVVVGALK